MYQTIPQNTTAIDDLPDLSELEGGRGPNPYQPATLGNGIRESRYEGAAMLPPGQSERYQKFIRGGHTPLPESGMVPPNYQPSYEHQQTYEPYIQENLEHANKDVKTINMPENSPSCLDVCSHVMNCPVCSRYYNTDKTVYIIIIAILAVISILLLKNVLDL